MRLFFLALWAGLSAALPLSGEEAPRRLDPGLPLERELAGGGEHVYAVEIAAGGNVLITADQRGADVELEALDPAGRSLGIVDSGRSGPEILLISAGTAGSWRIEARRPARNANAAKYEIRAELLPASTPAERERIEAEQLSTQARILARRRGADETREALERFGEALRRFRQLGRRWEEAATLTGMARLRSTQGESRPAIQDFEQALKIWEELAEPSRQAEALTGMGLAWYALGEDRQALGLFDRALAIYRSLGDRLSEAVVVNNTCLVHNSQGRPGEALSCYQRLLPLFRELGEQRLEAISLTNLGGVYDSLGEPRPALDHYRQAVDLFTDLGDRQGEAQALNNLGVTAVAIGEVGEALARYDRALALFRELGDRRWEARTLYNQGYAYFSLGELQRARASFEAALTLRRAVGDRRGEVFTLSLLGSVHQKLGEVPAALGFFQQALVLARELGDRFREASALSLIGKAHLEAERPGEALEALHPAVAILRELGNRSSLASALQGIGDVQIRRGDLAGALEAFREALDLRRSVTDRAGEAQTLTSMARAEAGFGRLSAARAHTQGALALIESLRTQVASPELRASFLGLHRRAFDLEIDLLMRLHRADPSRGYDREALEVSERARGRFLLDLLEEARADIRQGGDPELRQREKALAERLNLKAERQVERLSGSASPELLSGSEREIQELLTELDAVRAMIRSRSPRYAALTQPKPLRASEIQALLDAGTVLLEFSLGEERSYLWRVEAGAVASFELPPRGDIEKAARQVYEGMRRLDTDGSRAWESAAAALSRTLLGPVAGQLSGRRLVIVADGALHYLPFGALPVPDAPAGAPYPDLLLDRHEIVALPSASVLAIQRRDLGGRPPAPKVVAVLADPVFDATDTRLAGKGKREEEPRLASGSLDRGGDPDSLPALPRLSATRTEAERIAALVPPDRSLVALDFQVSRDLVLGGWLAPYQIVHFATHGVVNAQTPELSGLVLSRVGEDGRPREGFLSLTDIYNLDLGADLVVLSGCETALGREIRGEGLVGLTQGFFYAGSARVVASLWRVQDRATSELMGRFYGAMLREGKTPAAALREAQLTIRRERRWRNPFYWAAFVMQGDWN